MKILLGLLATLVLANAALACDSNPPPNCYCKNGQWYSNITNNVYNSTVNGVNGNVSPVATAGAGATATANPVVNANPVANGGSVSNAGNNANTNTQNQTNSQQQNLNNSGNNSAVGYGGAGGKGGQGGKGGAGGNAQNTSSNVNNVSSGPSSASIAAGAVQNTLGSNASVNGVSTTSGATVGDVSTGASTSAATASGNGNGSGNSVTYEAAKTYRAPVATAYAASLTSGADTCLGSVSGGAQTQIFGFSLGGTKRDKGCDLIKQTHLLMELQQNRAACIRAQLKEEGALIKEAMKEAGAECPPLVTPVVEAPVVVPPADVVTRAELNEVERRITTHIVTK